MHSAAVLALLLCAWQVAALPVNSALSKADTEVMKCIVEVISDTLSKPNPMPVSQGCFETLQGDERILSILRHQNLLKELQDLALQGSWTTFVGEEADARVPSSVARAEPNGQIAASLPPGAQERVRQQEKQSGFEAELSEVLHTQSDQATQPGVTEVAAPEDTVEKRQDMRSGEAPGGARSRVFPEPGRESATNGTGQTPEEVEGPHTQPPPSQKHPGTQANGDGEGPSQGPGDRDRGLGAEQGPQAKGEEEEEEARAGEEASSEEEGPTAAGDTPASRSLEEVRKGESRSEVLALDGARKTKAELPEGQGERGLEEEEPARVPPGPTRGRPSRGPELEELGEEFSKEWEDAKRWSKMEQLAQELTAEKRLEGKDEGDADPDPDRSMKLSFRSHAYGLRDPGPHLRRGWRPSSREDSVEAGLPARGHSYPEEKKEEEGSANRRAEDQELESLSAIEAELEEVAQQLQALRRG